MVTLDTRAKLLSIAILGALSLRILGFQNSPAQRSEYKEPHPVRYVIVGNYPLHSGRLVIVLMDEKSLSEKNLRIVFGLISKRFPKPARLDVGLYTNLEQVPTPEEEDLLKSNPNLQLPFLEKADKYAGASYTRDGRNEAFQYSTAEGQPEITVVIAGKNPFK